MNTSRALIPVLPCNPDDFLQPELEARGYRGAFLAKCSSPAMGYGYGADGCALFFRQERFEAVSPLEGDLTDQLLRPSSICAASGAAPPLVLACDLRCAS